MAEMDEPLSILINKDGREMGPFPLPVIQSMVKTGVLVTSDWAWILGGDEWIPIERIPGYGVRIITGVAADAGPRRPFGVWVICGYFLVCALVIFAYLIGFLFFHVSGQVGDEKVVVPVGSAIVGSLILMAYQVGVAILLFKMKRLAFYLIVPGLLIHLVISTGSFVMGALLAAGLLQRLVAIGFASIDAFILYYLWTLERDDYLI